MRIFTELGLNHLGDEATANRMVEKLLNTKSSGISFQILKKSFYTKDLKNFFYNNDKNFLKGVREKNFYIKMKKTKKFKKLFLSDDFYISIIKKIRNKKKKVGVAISDINKIKFFSKHHIDFFKILSKDFKNFKLINRAINSKAKKIYLSTGNHSLKSIIRTINKIPKKKLVLIYTKFKDTIKEQELENIKHFKNKINIPIIFGNHCYDFKIFDNLKEYDLSSIFVYVKEKNYKSYPDTKHALLIDKIDNLFKKMN